MKDVTLMRHHRARSMLIAAGFLLGLSSAARSDEDHSQIELRGIPLPMPHYPRTQALPTMFRSQTRKRFPSMLRWHTGSVLAVAIIAGLPFDCNRPAGIFDVFWNWLHFNQFTLDGADTSYSCGIAEFSRTDREAAEWAGYVTESANAGNARVDSWSIKGFAHAFPIDANCDPEVCGLESEFILNANLYAVRRIADFWHLQ